MPVSGIILAGGKSRRLGTDKAFLSLDGETLIERVLRTTRSLVSDVLIVANDHTRYANLGARLISDIYPGKASLGGIYSGLLAAENEQALVLGCDMPFLSTALLRHMLRLADASEVIIPRYGAYLEPLHAIYHKCCLDHMRRLIESNQLRISQAFCDATTRFVEDEEIERLDPDKLSFFNINTPEDLERARARISCDGARDRGAFQPAEDSRT